MVSWSFFSDAFSLVVRHPKLLVPKLLVALLYGFVMLESARLSVALAPSAFGVDPLSQAEALALLGPVLLLSLGSIFVLLLDVWISSWYPELVSQFHLSKRVSFRLAIQASAKRFWVSVPLLAGFDLVVSIILAIISTLVLLVSPALFGVTLVGSLIALLVIYVFTYPLLSVSVLEKGSYWQSLSRSFALSRKNWVSFSPAALLSFLVSLLNFGLAFLVGNPALLLLFWGVRFFLAVIVTYTTVVNPSAYLAVIGSSAP